MTLKGHHTTLESPTILSLKNKQEMLTVHPSEIIRIHQGPHVCNKVTQAMLIFIKKVMMFLTNLN